MIAGGVSILGGTDAFSQLNADRSAFVKPSNDQNSLLGVDLASSVQAGIDDQHLADLSNNAANPLDVSLWLSDPTQGSLSDSDLSLSTGETQPVAVSVAYGSPTGEDALSFEVVGSDDDSLAVSLTRAIEVTDPPVLKQQVRDYTQNNNASFSISYRVSRLPNFDRIEIEVENVDAGHIGQETYVQYSPETTVWYPPGGGSDGGTAGDTYEFRFRVYDDSGEYEHLYTEVSTTADGNNPPGDDLRGDTDPELISFTATNEERWTNNRFTVDYEVGNLKTFDEVQVEFDNTQNDWSDRTIASEDAPTGTVIYPSEEDYQGGINGHTYEITVEVYNQSGIPVDTGTVTIEAGSNETVEWP